MKRSSWLLVPLVLGILWSRSSSAQSEAPPDNLSAQGVSPETGILFPGPVLGEIVEVAPPPEETPLVIDNPSAPGEEVSDIQAEVDLGNFEVQEAHTDELPPGDPAAEEDLLVPGAEEAGAVVEPPEPMVLPDDATDDPEALVTGEDLEVEDVVLPPGFQLYTPPSPEEIGEVYPPIDGEEPPAPELPPELGQPPVLDPIESRAVDEGQTLSFPVQAHDPDAGQTAAIYTSALPEGAAFDGTTLSWTPSFFQAGTYHVSFAAMDDGSPAQLSPVQIITITVNDVNQPPFATPDFLVTDEDHAAQPLDPRTNDADLDGDALGVRAVSQGSSGAVVLNPDGTVTYTPSPNFSGTDSFSYTLSDGRGGTATGTVHVTVNPVNDPPSFAKGADQTVAEDAGPQSVASWATQLASGPGETGQTLTFEVSNDHPTLFSAPPAIAADGTLSYAAAPDANGAATLTVRLRDSGGTDRGGVDTSAPQTFTITVNPVNDPPVLAAIADQTIDEGQSLVFQVTATDIDSPVSLSLADAPAGASFTDNHDGTADFAWTPSYTQAGVYPLTFTASDGSLSDSKSITVTVVNVTRTLSASAGAGGTINPAGARVVDYGSDQTFTFTHATGYHLTDVLVDEVSVGAVSSYTFSNITADHTIAASFAIDTFTLAAQPGANGGIAPANQTVVTYGSSLSYSITPATGYSVADVLVDRVSVGAVSSYSFTNITADHTIAASFADVTAPVVTAQLTGVWGRRGDDDDDDGPMYRVRVSATDGADPQPAITAFITQPLSPPPAVTVGYKKEKKVRIKIKKESRKLQVQLEGPSGSEEMLRKLWADAFDLGGFPVADNQVVRLTVKEGESAESEYRFDKQLTLTSAKAPNLKLVASAKDASGNQSAKVEARPPRFRLSKSADEALAQGMEVITADFGLQANYPNPFNPTTTLRYSLDDLQEVRLTIYNAMGQRVQVLVDQAQGPGNYEVEWNGLDQAGQQVAGGVYFYQLRTGSKQATGRMLFLK